MLGNYCLHTMSTFIMIHTTCVIFLRIADIHNICFIIGDPNSAQAKEEKVMRSPAVTTIKEMGYSEDKIKAAIHTIKSRLPRGRTVSQ